MALSRTSTVVISLEDQHAIRRLKYEYCRSVDEQAADQFVQLFSENATLDTPTTSARGRDELRAFIEELRDREIEAISHVPTNPIVDVDGDQAVGRWYYVVLISNEDGTTELGQGRYGDTYSKVDGEWLIDSTEARRRHTVQSA